MKSVYMDNQAGTTVEPRILEAMKPYFLDIWGNPSSTHSFGQQSREAVEKSREVVARSIGAERSNEVIFTSGGTESNNLALIGFAQRNRDKGNHIVVSSIEHISVLNIYKYLTKLGFAITYLPVDKTGLVDPQSVRKELTAKTILISVMTANGATGTL